MDIITEISLDHDPGDVQHGAGYDAILGIEENVVTQNFRPSVTRFLRANF
ncbi:hypothetical protein GCM10027342_52540 [Photobacterium alginatilyticum]